MPNGQGQPFMEPLKLSPVQFDRFRSFIYRHSGIQIDPKKVTMLSNRIRRRLKAKAFSDFDAYFRYLNSVEGRPEIAHFFDAVTTHETSFFRTPKQFDWLRGEFVDSLLRQEREANRAREIKLWSAGCSNGAEAYSMAMCLLENRFRLRDWQLDIMGTDISQENIAEARIGNYQDKGLSLVSEEQCKRWFRRDTGGTWSVRDSLREVTRFHVHNLIKPPEEREFDCIFIRNVLIYFDADSKRLAVRNLLAALRPGGYLVIGPSEGIHDFLGSLERVEPLIYQRPEGRVQQRQHGPATSGPSRPSFGKGGSHGR